MDPYVRIRITFEDEVRTTWAMERWIAEAFLELIATTGEWPYSPRGELLPVELQPRGPARRAELVPD